MFEAMLAALPDRDFYEKREFSAQIREAYLDSEIPYGCLVAGAKVWDPSLHPEYPVFSLCKKNNEDNKVFVPFRDANLILSSTSTGELLSFMMREDAGKMPLYDRKPAAPPKFDAPLVKSYSVNELWRPIPANRIPIGEDHYQAFIHVGDFQSDDYTFHVLANGKNQQPKPFERLLTMVAEPPESPSPLAKVAFGDVRDAKAPIPEQGLVFKVQKHVLPDGAPGYKLRAEFRFGGKWGKDWKRVPIHALIAVPGSQQPLLRTLWLPRKSARFLENGYAGSFEFELTECFVAFPGQKPKIPPSAWVSFVHRDWHGSITRIDFGAP